MGPPLVKAQDSSDGWVCLVRIRDQTLGIRIFVHIFVATDARLPNFLRGKTHTHL